MSLGHTLTGRTLKRLNIKESIKTTHFSIKINKDNQRASKKYTECEFLINPNTVASLTTKMNYFLYKLKKYLERDK